jgi:hypothetical protein
MNTQAQQIATRIAQLAESDPAAFAAASDAYTERHRAAGLFFEDRVDPVSLLPLPLRASDDAEIRAAAARLLALLEKMAELYRADPAVRDFFPAYRSAEQWLLPDPGLRPNAGVCRLDGVLIDGRFQIMEASTGGPGGVIKVGAELELWRNAVADVLGIDPPSYGDQPFGSDPLMFIRHLIRAHEQQFAIKPHCAAVVGLGNEFSNEVALMIDGLRQLGVAATQLDATELRRAAGRGMTANGFRPTLTFNKLDQVKLIHTLAAYDYLDAMASGQVCVVPTLLAHCVLDDKSVLAFLTDPLFSSEFTATERDTIARHVPWTRRVRSGRTAGPYGGPVDLMPYAIDQQRRLVLKPNDRTRGEGLLIGAETSPDQWQSALSQAVRAGNHVIQQYLALPEINVPFGDPPAVKRMKHGLDVFLFGGRFAGYMCRASVDTVINVGKRGIMLPVAIQEETG